VFTRYQGGRQLKSGRAAAEISAVFTVNLDGTSVQRVSGWGWHVGQADWSPDGTRIVFEQACCRLGDAGIYTVDAQGGQLTRIVDGHGVTGIGNPKALQVEGYYDPVWSPDGTKIIAGREFLDDDGTFTVGFVLVNADGTDLHWASSSVNVEHQPDWGTAPVR
jgi:Tol biopolymer transport system component